MKKSAAYHQKKHITRAQQKAAKRRKAQSMKRNTETPRNQRQRGTQTPALGSFAATFSQKFTAALWRGRAA